MELLIARVQKVPKRRMKNSIFKAILLLGLPGAGKTPFGDFLEKKIIYGHHLHHFDFGRELRAILKNFQLREKNNPGFSLAKEIESSASDRKNLSPPIPRSKPGHNSRSEDLLKSSSARNTQETDFLAGTPFNLPFENYFSLSEIERLRLSVESGTLFEEEDKELVKKIFHYYLQTHQVLPEDWLVLNGLPRHVGQVNWLRGLVDLRLVLYLVCSEEVARKRLAANLDGERSERMDDRSDIISRRHQIYRERTEPLVGFFNQRGIPVVELKVEENTRPEELWVSLQQTKALEKIKQ
ncbi:MAG TPA: hypothetical protein ENO29_03155 [Candidatus Aminicenantes bacterium]|nr:hypothetical protein [Candidatus Aminicenantes bacterium]